MNLASKKKLEQKFSAIRDEAERRGKAFKETPIPKIRIGMATCGTASGAVETRKAFEEVLAERDIEARIHTVGCVGHCYAEPVVAIETPGFPPILYHQVTPGKARMLVNKKSAWLWRNVDALIQKIFMNTLRKRDTPPL
jgi:NADH-quinone oxidoreductase subunit F